MRWIAMLSLLVAPVAVGGEVTTYEWDNDYDDIVNERLVASFEHHVAPAVHWFADVTASQPVKAGTFREFARQFLMATYATFVYAYQVDGVEYERTYFASSGDAQPRLGGMIATRPYMDFVSLAANDVHAVLKTSNQSTISYIPLDDGRPADARQNDAELKAVRSIERDILSGVVPRGGEVTAFVSQPMCESCARAVHTFAQRYDATVYVNAPRTVSGWASFRFQRKRKAFLEAARASLPAPIFGGMPRPTRDGPPPPPSCGGIVIQ